MRYDNIADFLSRIIMKIPPSLKQIANALPFSEYLKGKVRYFIWSQEKQKRYGSLGEGETFYGYQGETFKARARRMREGFFEKYSRGKGLDIGFGGDLLTKNCRGWDFEDGDAQYLRGLKDHSFDFVYSSHTLEDLPDLEAALKNWWRVLKPGGFFILYLPERDLYEKKLTLPSRWNPGHRHFFLLDRDEKPHTVGLLPLIARTISDYELIYAKVCDEGHTITDPEQHSDGEYSLEVVLKKLLTTKAKKK